MKKNILFFFVVFTSFLGSLCAQNITLLGSTSFSAKGNGIGGKPTNINWNIPAGSNRVMIVHFWFERDHRPSTASNYPSGTLGANFFPLTVGGVNVAGKSVLRTFHIVNTGTGDQNNAQLNSSFYRYTISDSQGLPTGAATFDFSGILTPANVADEVAVSIEVYGNVSQTSPLLATGSNSWLENAAATTIFSITPTAATTPIGRLAADVMYVGFGGTSKDESISISTGWTTINNVRVNNIAGSSFNGTLANEADGISLLTAYRNGSATTTLTKSSSQSIGVVRMNIVPLLPLAKPSIAGNVYSDIDGSANINGTGTNGGGLYVNLVDINGILVYSATVNAAGVFTIPTGYATEEESYKLQLSKNTGTLGSVAPVKELNSGWTAVGEATSATGNDGTSDNVLSITAGTINITGLRYGIKTCNSGSAAPIINATSQYSDVLSSYSIPCGSLTANLTALTASNTPLGTTITWHTSANATDTNKIVATAISGTVKMYAAFYDAIALCYSPTKEIVVGAPICAGDDNYSATPIIAGVGATLPSIFSNDTYNGINIATLPLNTVEFLYELWTPANATVDLAGNGSLIIPASALPGTYTYYYKICDKDPDIAASSNCAIGAVTFVVVDPCAISASNPDSDGDGISNYCDLDDDNDGILDTSENPCTLTRSTTWSGTGSPVSGVNGSGVSTNNITMTSVAASGANTSFTASPNDTFNTTNFWSNPAVAGANSLQFVHAWDTTPEDTQQASVDGGTRTYTITFAKPVNKAIIHLDRLGGNYQIFPANYFSNSTEFTLTSSGISMKKIAGNNQLIVSTNKFYRNFNVDLGSVNPGSEANNTTGSAAGSIEFSSTTGQLFTSLTFSVAGQGIEGQGNDGIEFIIESCIGTDTDGDGIPNNLDLDSDGDGCSDAIEGAGAFTTMIPSTMPGGNSGASYNGLSSAAVTQNLGNTVGNTATTMGVPTVAGTGQAVGQSQNGFKNDCQDADGDLIPDWQDLDDDNDGILDTTECPTTVNDFVAAFGAGATTDILPSDFSLALNAKNQNVTRDLSAKFGYPVNSGAVIVSITNASVHPSTNVWWTKNGEQPSIWKVTGTMSAFLAMGHDLLYYSNDSKTFHIYDNADVIPVTVPGLANQTAVAGQWSVSETQSQKTLNNLNTNTSTAESGNWRYINMNFGSKSFGFSTTVASGEPNYGVVMLLECDTDKDGIPDRLDLDSDNDGCLDAIEGDENVSTLQLVNAAVALSVGTGSTASNQNLGNTVDANGVPTVVNSGGVADIGADQGQGIGSSTNATINSCYCYKPAVLDTSNNYPTKHGITALSRAGAGDTDNWPMTRQSAWMVLESKEKGFVVNRVTTTANLANITNPVEGMMVYDEQADCLKIYTVKSGDTVMGWHCFLTPTCPD